VDWLPIVLICGSNLPSKENSVVPRIWACDKVAGKFEISSGLKTGGLYKGTYLWYVGKSWDVLFLLP